MCEGSQVAVGRTGGARGAAPAVPKPARVLAAPTPLGGRAPSEPGGGISSA